MTAATMKAEAPAASEFTCNLYQPDMGEWRALRGRMPPESAFLGGGWIETWAESYLPYGRWRGPCRYLSVRDGHGELAAVLPFATMKFSPFEFRAGGGYFLPYRGVALAAPEGPKRAACAALADALIDYTPWRLGLRIGPVCDQDGSSRALAAALKTRGWLVGTRRLGQCMVLEVPRTLAEFSHLSGDMIKRVSYYERRMRRTGRLEIGEFRSLERRRWQSVLLDAAAIERNSWLAGASGGHLIFATGADQKFWIHVVDDEFFSSALALWLMYLDDRPVSLALTLDAGDRKFILANLYDEQFKNHSPGHILTDHVIREAIQRSQRYLDWGLGDSGYKQRWGAKPGYTLYDLLAFPPGPIGRILKRAIEWRSLYLF
jgi:Acetyltransferase (GNAT) domain